MKPCCSQDESIVHLWIKKHKMQFAQIAGCLCTCLYGHL